MDTTPKSPSLVPFEEKSSGTVVNALEFIGYQQSADTLDVCDTVCWLKPKGCRGKYESTHDIELDRDNNLLASNNDPEGYSEEFCM